LSARSLSTRQESLRPSVVGKGEGSACAEPIFERDGQDEVMVGEQGAESTPEQDAAVQRAAISQGWSHRHRDVSGGWLRPTVFGAVDGLVTNASLIAGVGGGGVASHTIVLTGLAGLVAGAFSMGTGEYVSVTNQNELVQAEVAVERSMHLRFPAAEQAELAETFRGYGADTQTAARMAEAVSRDPETALRVHTRDELGVDPEELPSPILAGGASLIAFSLGAVLPLLPYLLGHASLTVSLLITGVALTVGGMVVGRLTGRSLPRSGARQLALGAVAVAVTFAIGHLIGSA
jgi:vacuolar iron transporter family protein